MEDEKLILIDAQDNEIGVGTKTEIHSSGRLHRAFSIFIFNMYNDLLLQQRAWSKYHSKGLWTNTCCGHPRHGEDIMNAVHRRLQEEMGFDCTLSHIFSFMYKTEFIDGLFEHEYDYVFIGTYNSDPLPNKSEVEDWKWISFKDLTRDIKQHGSQYTHWFKLAIPQLMEYLHDINKTRVS